MEDEIRQMFYEEYLTVYEIAGALHQSPDYVYWVLFRKKNNAINRA